MLTQIQGYNYSIEYRKGGEMILVDTLSQMPNPREKITVELDMRIDGIELEADDPNKMKIPSR